MRYIAAPPAAPPPEEPSPAPPEEAWLDRTVRIKRLGDPEIRRPEKPWHPQVYAGVHSELSYEDEGPRIASQPTRSP